MKSGTRPPLRSARLLDQLRERIRYCHYSLHTEQAYVFWVRRFIRFHRLRHPRSMGLRRSRRFSPTWPRNATWHPQHTSRPWRRCSSYTGRYWTSSCPGCSRSVARPPGPNSGRAVTGGSCAPARAGRAHVRAHGRIALRLGSSIDGVSAPSRKGRGLRSKDPRRARGQRSEGSRRDVARAARYSVATPTRAVACALGGRSRPPSSRSRDAGCACPKVSARR
jgi:hypothetical protein